MSKVSELNKLAEKIIGESPNENTIKEILDSISSYLKGSKIKSANTEKAIKNVAENYSGSGGGGGSKPVVPGEGEGIYSPFGIMFVNQGTEMVQIGDDVASFYEELDFSQCKCFIAMFKNSFITHGPEMDTSSGENFNEMFMGCESLISIPQYDFSKGNGAMGLIDAFNGCVNLTTVPNLVRTPSDDVMYLENMFYGCDSLSDNSLNNIMAMCINCPNSEYKELSYLGISAEQATKCESLSNYSALIDAGWTTGY